MRISGSVKLIALVAAFVAVSARAGAAQVIHCDAFRTSDNAYAGRCFQEGTTVSLVVLRPPANKNAGRWLGTQARIFGEGADTADVMDWTSLAPTFVDVGKKDGIFNWCWCVVTNATIDTSGLHFDADPERPAPPTAEDVRILQLARSYFTDSTKWSRTDSRNRAITYCPAKPQSRTLFCALYDATVAIRGDNYWGRAGSAVQAALRAATTRRYQHPITQFNNDPETTFTMLQRMLDDAIARLRAEIGKPPAG